MYNLGVRRSHAPLLAQLDLLVFTGTCETYDRMIFRTRLSLVEFSIKNGPILSISVGPFCILQRLASASILVNELAPCHDLDTHARILSPKDQGTYPTIMTLSITQVDHSPTAVD